MSNEFIGCGLGLPAALDQTGGIRAGRATMRGDRGGHPADPRHGLRRAADAARVSAAPSTTSSSPTPTPRPPAASPTRCARRCAAGSRASRSTTSTSPSTRTTAACCTSTSATTIKDDERPAQPGLPLLHRSRRARRPAEERSRTMTLPVPEPRRPSLPGPGRRRQAPGPAALPEWTDHNVSDPGVTLIEALRLDDRPAALPAQPRARPQLHQVPRADRRPPVPADRGQRAGHVLALGAAAGHGHHPDRHRGRHARAPDTQAAIVFSDDRGPGRSSPRQPRHGRLAARPQRRSRDHTDALAIRRRLLLLRHAAQAGRRAARRADRGGARRAPSTSRFECRIEGVGVDPD